MNILEAILAHKREEVAAAKTAIPPGEMQRRALDQAPPRSFRESLLAPSFALIAEIKKASPSRGVIVEKFDHRSIAREYAAGGAHALSVLTDRKFFQGHPSYIREIKDVVDLPVLRKDFIIDEYQVYESRALGADALLLLVRVLSPLALEQLHALTLSLGMAALVEAHSEEEIGAANAVRAQITGINNRDLATFEVSLQASIRLRHFVRSESITVSESGIGTRADIEALRSAGFRAALVGEGIVKQDNRSEAVRSLLS